MAFTSVVTHATGDVFPAADWNTYVRDNLAYLHGDAGTVNMGASPFTFPGLVSTATAYLAAPATTGTVFTGRVGADTVGRIVIDSNGAITWGPGGSTAADTTLQRRGVGQLQIGTTAQNGQLVVYSSGTAVAPLSTFVTTETNPRLQILGDGTINWGPGGATAVDTSLNRPVAGILSASNRIVEAYVTTSGGAATWTPSVANGVVQRYNMTGTGTLTIASPGAPPASTSCYLTIIVHNAAGATVTVAWNAIYVGGMATSLTTGAPTSINTFVYNPGEAKWYLISSLTTTP